jgi:dTDP-4-dehydrorhamnose 3,5-epimerase-like enzyme
VSVAAPVKYSANGRQTIDGVKVKPLKVLADERGWLMAILRADETDLFT